jgi:hypothetical protein
MLSEERRKGHEEELVAEVRQMYRELYAWREEHPEASFDEIASQVTPRRRELMAVLLRQLAEQHGSGVEVAGVMCPECGQEMTYGGTPPRDIGHYMEGEIELQRAYYHCEHCHSGIFPPGQMPAIGEAHVDAGDSPDDGASGG